jgi:general stress protein 26
MFRWSAHWKLWKTAKRFTRVGAIHSTPFSPEGPSDKSILLLRFHADRAEYWDSQTNLAVIAYERAKARFTGKFPNLCDHEKVELKG